MSVNTDRAAPLLAVCWDGEHTAVLDARLERRDEVDNVGLGWRHSIVIIVTQTRLCLSRAVHVEEVIAAGNVKFMVTAIDYSS